MLNFKFPCFLGLRLRGGKDFDDAASDVSLSSTTSGYRSGRGENCTANPDPAEACQALDDTEIKI
jgi:hypothetical protein